MDISSSERSQIRKLLGLYPIEAGYNAQGVRERLTQCNAEIPVKSANKPIVGKHFRWNFRLDDTWYVSCYRNSTHKVSVFLDSKGVQVYLLSNIHDGDWTITKKDGLVVHACEVYLFRVTADVTIYNPVKFIPNLTIDVMSQPREVIMCDKLFSPAVWDGVFTGVWFGRKGVFNIAEVRPNAKGKLDELDLVPTSGIGGFMGVSRSRLMEYLDMPGSIKGGMPIEQLALIPLDMFVNSILNLEAIPETLFDVASDCVAHGDIINPFISYSGAQSTAIAEIKREYVRIIIDGRIGHFMVIHTKNVRLYKSQNLLYLPCAGFTMWMVPADDTYDDDNMFKFAFLQLFNCNMYMHWTQTYGIFHVNIPDVKGLLYDGKVKLPTSFDMSQMAVVRQIIITLRFACCKDKFGGFAEVLWFCDPEKTLQLNARVFPGWIFDHMGYIVSKALMQPYNHETIELVKGIIKDKNYTITSFFDLLTK